MLSSCVSSGSRMLAQRSAASASLHTSAVLSAAKSSLRIKRQNISNSIKREKEQSAVRPSIILGTRPGEEWKWKECDLAKILVDAKTLDSQPEPPLQTLPIGPVRLPESMAYGVDEAEKHLLFGTLPEASLAMAHATSRVVSTTKDPKDLDVSFFEADELRKANLLAKALDLRNANAAGIAFENRRRIIKAFSSPENPYDPGRTEVQVALLTYKIRNLWDHLTTFKRDVGNRRALGRLVHQRASLLKYLKKVSLNRYDILLERLALEPESVEGELVI